SISPNVRCMVAQITQIHRPVISELPLHAEVPLLCVAVWKIERLAVVSALRRKYKVLVRQRNWERIAARRVDPRIRQGWVRQRDLAAVRKRVRNADVVRRRWIVVEQ